MADKINILKPAAANSSSNNTATSNTKSLEGNGYNKQLGNVLYGFNHRNTPLITSTIQHGNDYIFFTRPHFNMMASNLRNDRTMTNLITTTSNNTQTFIRQTLDPSLAENEKISCPLLNNNLGFIPILSNTLKSMSGWPDRMLPTYASRAGARGEQYSIPDGIVELNGKYDLTLTFDRMDGEINEKLLETWMDMMSLQVDGMVSPYTAFEVYTERNFDTRIYVLTMDATNRVVLNIGVANAAFPTNDNIGRKFDYNKNIKMADAEFSIRMETNVITYNDPILILEFNMVNSFFNNNVYNMLHGQSHNLKKINADELSKYNYRGYPYIDVNTMELCWYVENN